MDFPRRTPARHQFFQALLLLGREELVRAQLLHHDGNAPESRASGSGRVTWGKYLTYDLKLNAEPLSFTTLARSYPAIPLRGDYSGPMQIAGTSPNLCVVTTLTGAGGTLAYDGTAPTDHSYIPSRPRNEARGYALSYKYENCATNNSKRKP